MEVWCQVKNADERYGEIYKGERYGGRTVRKEEGDKEDIWRKSVTRKSGGGIG